MTERQPASSAGDLPPTVTATPSVTTAAGVRVRVAVQVTNTAAQPRTLRVGVLGADHGWVGEPAVVEDLVSGESAEVAIEVAPPLGTAPGRYPLVVTAESLEPATMRAAGRRAGTADVTVVVNPRTQVTLELDPAETSGVVARRFWLSARNTGLVTARIDLEVYQPHHARVRLRSSALEVAPGETTRVRARVRVPRPRKMGGPIRHPFTISARGSEAVRHVDGAFTQRPILGPSAVKVVSLVAVIAVWLAAGYVFLPQLADRVRAAQESGRTVEATQDGTGREAGTEGSDDGAADGGDGSDEGSSDGGEDPGAGVDAEQDTRMKLAGTVASDSPAGVTVQLKPTSLVADDVTGARPVGIAPSSYSGSGMWWQSATVLPAVQRDLPTYTTVSNDDGTWALPPVAGRGYYLATFTKPGYDPVKYVVDASSAAATEPIEVPLTPGEGALSGRITSPGGAGVGGARVTITDGTHTLSTTSVSKGEGRGRWSITGLATPSTYVVMATGHERSSEAAIVDLDAGGKRSLTLTLHSGVAVLTGEVRAQAADLEAPYESTGGLQVSVTSPEGTVRSVNTVSKVHPDTGNFVLPRLPVPGSYVMTFSGPGLQSETLTRHLAKGATRVRLKKPVTLLRSTGGISGVVKKAADEPLGNAGLTLANGLTTYKTTSLSDDGAFEITGVEPGVYDLTIEYFHRETYQTTLEVEPGAITPVNTVTLRKDPADGVPATSSLVGTAADATNGLKVRCPDDPDLPTADNPGIPCLTATVDVEIGTTTKTFTTKFRTADPYTLPDAGTPENERLPPGLHTVRVTAPGYESTELRVEVGQGRVVAVPLAQLYPAPKVAGTVSTYVGSTPSTCVWAVPGFITDPPADLPDCADAVADAGGADPDPEQSCPIGESFVDGVTAISRSCASTDGTGAYSVQVPEAGPYTVFIDPADPEYLAQGPFPLNLQPYTTQPMSPRLDRLGRAQLTVLVPGANADGDARLVPSRGTAVTVTPGSGRPATFPVGSTNNAGQVEVRGLPSAEHTFAATVDEGTVHSGRVSQYVGLNQTVQVRLPLTDPVSSFVGRVGSTVDLADRPVPAAQVQVTIAAAFSLDGTPLPATPTMTTDGQGCFAVQSAAGRPLAGTTGPGALCDDTWPAGSLVQQVFVNDRASRVVITAPGYATLDLARQRLSTTTVNGFSLDPLPIVLDVPVTVDPGSAGFDWTGVTVTAGGPGGRDVDASVEADPADAGRGRLVWDDSALTGPDAGKVLPGTYQLTLTADGYEPRTSTMTCVPAGTCTLSRPLVLEKLGSLRIRTVDAASAAAVADAAVTRLVDGDEVITRHPEPGLNEVVFTGVSPGQPTQDTIRVQAAGYRFGTSNADGSPGVVTLDCDQGSPTGRVAVRPGEETVCDAKLTRIGSISGTVLGVQGPQGSVSPTRNLPSASVVATRCTALTGGRCTGISTASADRFTATSGANGQFTVTGTREVQGLDPGTYLLTASAPGYDPPAAGPGAALAGTTVVVTAGAAPADAYLYATPVDLDVELVDENGNAVLDASVRLTKNAVPNPGPGPGDPTGADPDGDGTYTFDDVIPGVWTVWITGPGLASTGVTRTVEPGASQSLRVEVPRSQAKVAGFVTSGGAPLGGVQVTLFCADGEPTSQHCPDSGPARGSDLADLVTTTAPDGTYELTPVPAGKFDVAFRLAGYDGLDVEDISVVNGQEVPVDADLTAVQRSVAVTVTTTHAEEDLTGATVRLVPQGSTPGGPLTGGPLSGGAGTFTSSFPQVRWGCYRAELTLPGGHLAAPSGPTGPATAGSPGCPAGRVAVPKEASADPVELGFTVNAGRVAYTVTTTPWSGHPSPAVALRLEPDGGGTALTIDPALATGTLWVPPGDYSVTPVLGGVPALFWPVAPLGTSVPSGSGQGTVTVDLTEVTAEVTITVDDLAPGEEADLQISPAGGQTGAPPSPSVLSTTGGTVTLELPYGRWLIEGAWSNGPDAETLDVTARTHQVTLQAGP